ncbi:vlp protein, beta subfamily (plasmid) [Borrelia turicatae]|uniref:Variable large protein n=1 Tax=Borrelia turicatae TaxID=142 RepID=A0A172XDD6_BORTU|nr:vlp protein, beta subfamily [Borrelia turicatae]
MKKGLGDTKDKLDGLAKDITSTPHADTTGVESTIKGASEVFERLIAALTTLADTAKAAGDTNIGDAATDNNAVGADENSVKAIIDSVKEIIKAAEESGVKINVGDAGNQIAAGAANAVESLARTGAAAAANSGPKLAAEVSKADPWAMIDKIKDAKTSTAALVQNNNNHEAGLLAGGTIANGNNAGAKTNADLAAAVALKAMTKGGKFAQPNGDEAVVVKAAAISAVNKVLGVLDFIIRKTVESNLEKIGEAVKGIKYLETTTESTEASTTQPVTAK